MLCPDSFSYYSGVQNAEKPTEPDLSGKVVGALKYSLQDSILIAENGGIVQSVDFNNTMDGIIHMMDMLERGDIQGIVLTRPMYYYFARMLEQHSKFKYIKDRFANEPLEYAEKKLKNKMVTGMLVRRREDYEYFRKYFKDNWLQIQGCYMVNLNYKHLKFRTKPADIMIGLFVPFLSGCLAVVGFVLLFGVVYEGRKMYLKKNFQPVSTDVGLNMKINETM